MVVGFFPMIGVFGWLGFLLCIGVVLRAKVPFFQKFLIPASLIGGIIGFILMSFGLVGMPTAEGYKAIPPSAFALITFHLFAFNFVGIGLIQSDKHSGSKNIAKGAIWIAILLNVIMAAQIIIGLLSFGFWGLFDGEQTNVFNGALLAAGFTQGPGQAQSYAIVWEGMGLEHSINIGFTFGAIGFLVSGFVGVTIARTLVKRGLAADKENTSLPHNFITGLHEQNSNISIGSETTHNANINSLAYQFGIMLFLYLVTYVLVFYIESFLPLAQAPLAFGLFFMFTLVVSIIFRLILTKLKLSQFLDNGITKSITSSCVDLLVCAVFLGISFATVQTFIWPILIACLLGTIITVFISIYAGTKLSEYGMERGIAVLGYATGTGPSALMLLRVIDPNFKSPVLVEMGLVVAVQVVTFLPVFTVLMPILPSFSLFTASMITLAILIVNIAIVYAIIYLQDRNKTKTQHCDLSNSISQTLRQRG